MFVSSNLTRTSRNGALLWAVPPKGLPMATRDEMAQSAAERHLAIQAARASVEPSEQDMQPLLSAYSDAPFCFQCGYMMQRAGACYVCAECGTTSGCS